MGKCGTMPGTYLLQESLPEGQNAPTRGSAHGPRWGLSPQTPTAPSAAQAPPQSQGLGEKKLGSMKKYILYSHALKLSPHRYPTIKPFSTL